MAHHPGEALDRSITDPTFPVGPWDGRELRGTSEELTSAFRTQDLLNLPPELWCASTLSVCQRIASGTRWQRLRWEERRAVTVALARALAHTLVAGDHHYLDDAEVERPLATDLDQLTAALITAKSRYSETETTYLPTGEVVRRQPAAPSLSELLLASEVDWESDYSISSVPTGSELSECTVEAALLNKDPTIVAHYEMAPTQRWLSDVWAKGWAFIENEIITKVEGETALTATWAGTGRWVRAHETRRQLADRDPAWIQWPPGAERIVEVSEEIFENLLHDDPDKAVRLRRQSRFLPGVGELGWEYFQELKAEISRWWNDPSAVGSLDRPARWREVRAILGWRCCLHTYLLPLKTLDALGRLLDAGASLHAARTYAVAANRKRIQLRTTGELRDIAVLGPSRLEDTIAELAGLGLLLSEKDSAAGVSIATVAELKQGCREAGLRSSGTRAELARRITDHAASAEAVGRSAWLAAHEKYPHDVADPLWAVVPSQELMSEPAEE